LRFEDGEDFETEDLTGEELLNVAEPVRCGGRLLDRIRAIFLAYRKSTFIGQWNVAGRGTGWDFLIEQTTSPPDTISSSHSG
jgi:hypothetical protein